MTYAIGYDVAEQRNYEHPVGVSLTVPDNDLSLRQLVDVYTRTGMVTRYVDPVYNGEEDLPDFSRMDLTEIDEYTRDASDRLKAAKRAYSDLSKKMVDKASKDANVVTQQASDKDAIKTD